MSWEIHIEWHGETWLVGRLHATGRGPAVAFEYVPEWLKRADAFPIDPTSLPLQTGARHSPALFGAIQDCGPDRWGRILIERAVRPQCAQPQLGAPHAAAFFAASFSSRAREVLVVERPPSAVQRNSRGIWPATRWAVSMTSSKGMTGS